MEYIRAKGIYYPNELRSIRKSSEMLQPIYEAFTNAWEAIYERFGSENFQHGKITISFYLVGENVDYEAISDKNPYFIEAANLKYIFRPDYPIKGKFDRSQGNLYTEIIKYSDILERAKNRNRIFLEKLEALE